MTAPTCRVFTFPVTAHSGPIGDRFDPPSKPARRLGLRLPNRLQGLHEEPDTDGLPRQRAEDRTGVAAQRIASLVPVLRILPASLVGFDISGGACVEGHYLGRLELLRVPLSTPGLDRIDPVVTHPAAFGRTFACLREGNRVERSQAHFARPAADHETEDPRLRPTGAHLEIEPAPIMVHPLLAGGLHLGRREPIRRTSHDLPSTSSAT